MRAEAPGVLDSSPANIRTAVGEPRAHPVPRGDEAELFRLYHRKLVRTIQARVRTSPDIVDGACALAWIEFLRHQRDRDRSWRSWLVTTAQREAWRLHEKEAAHTGLEVPGSAGLVREPVDLRDTLALRSELRAALDLLAAVPARRREAKALQVTGFKYEEIGSRLGLGLARVNALLAEADAAIRKEHGRVAPERQPRSPRAARLAELEEDPRAG
jgi:DNA-directed RNA polymerase specialized sigma24 family protein